MSKRDEIARRLGIFAKARFNCGIGPEGFQPGNNCGGKEGGGSAKSSGSTKPKRTAAQGIEDRARAAGRSFTEQYLHETRSAIDRDYKAAEAAAGRRAGKKADAEVRRAEQRLAEVKAAGPQSTPRMAELDRGIAGIDRRIAEVQKQREEARARQAAAAQGVAESKARMDDLKRRLAESKARSRGLRI